MKRALVSALKLGLPLAIGFWLIHKQYADLSPSQRDELFAAFGQADLLWLSLSMVVGWVAHVSRGWRWRYLLEPIGYRPGFWNCYHGVMVGYFINMFIPRAGEASRAAVLYRAEKVPFEKGFGTVMAERVVDTAVLLGIAGVTVLMQLDKLDLFRAQIDRFRAEQGPNQGTSGFPWFWVIVGVLLLVGLAGIYIVLTRPALKARLMDGLRGFFQGLQTVLRTKKKGLFILHTLLIWGCYLGMFQIGFFCLPGMSEVPFAAILAGFVAGAIGIVLVQGGIGVYPAFVALIVGIYMAPPEGGGLLRPDALAMGWLLWAAQTVMIIGLGGLSLLLTAFRKPVIA
ncbi:MAG TPA: lysylphosphatidylglycerol synthase transmembrane domain-containing protein [Flavobacteriales bacterium]|nr:lysylphosphatidylglycerol synthase transmembrane domain-containing protein [Flavobacteriales bacterium]